MKSNITLIGESGKTYDELSDEERRILVESKLKGLKEWKIDSPRFPSKNLLHIENRTDVWNRKKARMAYFVARIISKLRPILDTPEMFNKLIAIINSVLCAKDYIRNVNFHFDNMKKAGFPGYDGNRQQALFDHDYKQTDISISTREDLSMCKEQNESDNR